MFEHTKTWCFGRFIVKIPTEAKFESQWNEYYAKTIETGRGKEGFHEKVKAALEKRKNATHKYDDLYEKSEYPEGGNDQIIISKHKSISGRMVYSMDVFALRKANYYFYFTDAGPYDAEWIEKNVAVYRDIALPGLRYRPEYEFPKEPGFCFENGFIAGESKPGWNEEAGFYFTLKDYPDVQIRIGSEVVFASEPMLIERFRSKKEGWMHEDSAKKRVVAGIEGDEMLVSGVWSKVGSTQYLYRFESVGELKNPLKPGITLEIRAGKLPSGEFVEPALTKKQVRALYETIINSIQFRPVTPDGEAKPEPSSPALQPEAQTPEVTPQRLSTGERCTKTGLWRCGENDSTRHFTEGQTMPEAVLLKPATGLLNRIKGDKYVFSHTEPGHWEWVGEGKG